MFSKLGLLVVVLACTLGMLVSEFRVVVKPASPTVATSNVFFLGNFRNFPSADIILMELRCDDMMNWNWIYPKPVPQICYYLLSLMFERFVAFIYCLLATQIQTSPNIPILTKQEDVQTIQSSSPILISDNVKWGSWLEKPKKCYSGISLKSNIL